MDHPHTFEPSEPSMLPDLCCSRTVLSLLLAGEGLVIALLLVDTGFSQLTWSRFFLASLYMQWIMLVSLYCLCRLQVWLASCSARQTTGIAMGISLSVTLIVTLLSQWLRPTQFPNLDYGDLASKGVAAIIISAGLLRYCYVQNRWRQQIQAASKIRLQTLQALIRPHFFLNAINTVAALIPQDATKAESLLLGLAKIFRTVLRRQDSCLVTIDEELDLVQQYLEIEQTRLSQHLKVNWQLPDQIPDIKIPSLLLQPLVENAIQHGIAPAPTAGYLLIKLSTARLGWQLIIANSRDPLYPGQPGHQMSHDNIRQRLQTHYSGRAQLFIKSAATYYATTLFLPIEAGFLHGQELQQDN